MIEVANATGWRIASEVLPLEWRQVDFDAGEIRLDVGTTKNGEGRTFPMTADLRRVLLAQQVEQGLERRPRTRREVAHPTFSCCRKRLLSMREKKLW